MEDYAIPEIYRSACVANTELVGALEWALIIVGAVCDDMTLNEAHILSHVRQHNDPLSCLKSIHEAIRKHKGD